MASGGRIFNEHFFISNKFVQSLLGFRPDQSQNVQLFLLCAITMYVFPGLVHQLYQLFTSGETFQSTVQVLQKIIGIIILLTAYSTTYFGFVTMKLILTKINTNYEEVLNNGELNLFEKSEVQSKSYTYVVLGFYFVSALFNGYGISIIAPCIVKVCFYFLGILDENQLPLIVPVNNISKAGVKYFFLLIYQIIELIIILTIGGVSFSGYLVFVLFACYQFRELILKIRHPFERHLKYMGSDCYFRTSQEEWDWIIDIINRYKNVIEYANLLNNFSKISYLVTVFLAMSVIAFDFLYIYQLSVNFKDAAEIVECSFYIAGSILTLYINFYLGQQLINYSNVVFEELCQVPFYTLSNRIQKFLLFMIQRSCKPSMLSIGGIFVSSHQTFSALVRKSFSFAMVFYSTQ